MSEQPKWPPQPNVPDQATEHDAFLTNCVRTSVTKIPLSRLRLASDLRKETRLDLRQCLAIVNRFCDRHAILMPTRSPMAWIGCLPSLVQLATLIAMHVTWVFLERSLAVAPTRVTRMAILAERIHLDWVFIGIVLICLVFHIIFLLHRNKQACRDAEAAREKLGKAKE